MGIHTGQADESILDVYDEVRRRIWRDIIDPVSSENMTRLFKYSGPDEAMEKDAFFKMMRERKEAEEGDDPVSLRCHSMGGRGGMLMRWSTARAAVVAVRHDAALHQKGCVRASGAVASMKEQKECQTR